MLTEELRERFSAIEQAADRSIADQRLTKASEILNRVVYPLVIPALIRLLQAAAATGAEKKAAVLAMVDEFYDRRLRGIDLPGPFDGVAHAGLKYLAHDGAARLIDVLVAFLRSPDAASVLLSFQPEALRPYLGTAAPSQPAP